MRFHDLQAHMTCLPAKHKRLQSEFIGPRKQALDLPGIMQISLSKWANECRRYPNWRTPNGHLSNVAAPPTPRARAMQSSRLAVENTFQNRPTRSYKSGSFLRPQLSRASYGAPSGESASNALERLATTDCTSGKSEKTIAPDVFACWMHNENWTTCGLRSRCSY